MSINGSGMDDVDFGDFRVQHVHLEPNVEPDSPGARNEIQFEFDPLSDIGGLDNNEVAELVYLETNADLEYEAEVGDQDVAADAEMRGTVGINLAAAKSDFISRGGQDISGRITVFDQDNAELGGTNANVTRTDSKLLQYFRTGGGLPFDDETDGPGGSATHDAFRGEKYYRELTGRGPILDQNDSMAVNISLNVTDSVIEVVGIITLTMYWDVAETDDAGRRFSVPR